MLTMKIRRMTLENFKCHKSLSLDFRGENVSIYGDNATGKTSVYDALTWLLFGKDSAGSGAPDIKPLDKNGAVADHQAVTSVEAELEIGPETVKLRRTFREIWSTKRGSSQETYDGNTSEYYVDGAPCRKSGFDQKVRELVPEDVFRILTSVKYFPQELDWRKRREILFDMAGVSGDRDILGTDPRFAPLLDGMGKLTLDDYRAKLLSDKRSRTGAKTEIPARISECEKTIADLEGIDFPALREEADGMRAKRAELSRQLMALEQNRVVQEWKLELKEARLGLDRLEAENTAYRRRQTEGRENPGAVRAQLERMKSRFAITLNQLHRTEKQISDYDQEIDQARSRWISVNAEAFSGGNCPTCGQVLPMDQLTAAVSTFENGKRERLLEIQRTADGYKAGKKQAMDRLEGLKEDAVNLENEIARLTDRIRDAESVPPVEDMPGYTEQVRSFREEIASLESRIAAAAQDTQAEASRLRNEIAEIDDRIRRNQGELGMESTLEYSRRRIDELRRDARKAAEALEAIEKMLYLMDEYSRYKTRFVEGNVNGLFRIARFRLFREQANGGVEERCDVTYDGIPYAGLNSGAKINVGIDILNALSRHYGVRVPLFVDNAESVTRLEVPDTQVIRLVVSESDKELRVEHEN